MGEFITKIRMLCAWACAYVLKAMYAFIGNEAMVHVFREGGYIIEIELMITKEKKSEVRGLMATKPQTQKTLKMFKR